MKSILSPSAIFIGQRRYTDAEGRLAQVDHVDYQSGVVVYSIMDKNLVVQCGYRATIADVCAKWKIMDHGEKHPMIVAREKEIEEEKKAPR